MKKLIIKSLALLIIAISSQAIAQKNNTDLSKTLKNIDKYSQGITIGSAYGEAKKRFGKPLQKKLQADNAALFSAVWKRDNYSFDVSVNENNQIEAFGVHWFGLPDSVPEFKEIYAGPFKSETRKNTETSRQKNEALIICWTKKKIPERKEIISVLAVSKADPEKETCLFKDEIKY